MASEVLKEKIFDLINRMTENKEENIRTVKEVVSKSFENYPDISILHVLLSEIYPEEKCELLVMALIDCGADVNLSLDDYYGSFIQTAIVTGYSENFVESILSYSLAHGLDSNIVCSSQYDNDNLFKCTSSSNNTIMHTAIYSKRYAGSISNLYSILACEGFDFYYKNSIGETAFEAYSKHMESSDTFTEELEEMYNIEKDHRIMREEASLRVETLEKTMNTLKELISKMTDDIKKNEELVEEALDIKWRGPAGETLLHVLLDEKREDIDKCLKLAFALIASGVNVNVLCDDYYGSFIQTSIMSEYSDDFILEVLSEACRYGFNVNLVNGEEDTLLHTVIGYPPETSIIRVSKFFEFLSHTNYDFLIEDKIGDTALDSYKDIRGQDPDFESELQIIEKIHEAYILNSNTEFKKCIEELSCFGQILNNKDYICSPTIGREQETESLIVTLAQKKKSAILVGDSGVGKTAIVEELAYRIINGNVPSFLKNKLILEVSPSKLVAGQKYVGDFEKVIDSLVTTCLKYDCILFIDEIHSLFGTGSSDKSDMDMASIIKPYLERTSLKLIGTTTSEEYERYFSGTAMKRRFQPIKIKELSEDLLCEVADKVIRDYGDRYNIGCGEILETDIASVLVEITNKSHRNYFDKVCNPDLIVSIVDRAYAYALVDESDTVSGEYFLKAVNDCDRISSVAKEEAKELIGLGTKKAKCIIIPFKPQK